MVYTYAVMMTLILLSMIGVAITIYIYKDDVSKVITDGMKKGQQNYGKDDFKGVTEAWNIVQHELNAVELLTTKIGRILTLEKFRISAALPTPQIAQTESLTNPNPKPRTSSTPPDACPFSRPPFKTTLELLQELESDSSFCFSSAFWCLAALPKRSRKTNVCL